MKAVVVSIVLLVSALVEANKPNIIYILADDQDVLLNSLSVMPTVRYNLTEQGVYFDNAFATTPVCCPSRSSILTGKYVHNHGTYENTVAAGCANSTWRNNHEPHTIATYLSKAGYKTGLFGKYLNNYGLSKSGTDYTHIPKGWNTWYGLVGNSKFYDYTISNDGKEEKHGDDYTKDYLTDRVRDKAVQFIKDHTKTPFFAYISPPAPHRPATPSPKYAKEYFHLFAPHTQSYDVIGINKHWMISTGTPPMNRESIERTDNLFKDRLRSLRSVDELVASVIDTLKENDLLDNTYIIYHSDHGYHLGQFNQQGEKRQPYETDIRVPLIVRGPGVSKYQNATNLALNIDIAPTILDLAGVSIPDDMDGVSLKSGLHTEGKPAPKSYSFMLEYYGEGGSGGCMSDMGFLHDCHNNTWLALRSFNASTKAEFMYASFYKNDTFPVNSTQLYFREYYDLTKDPWELKNKAQALSDDQQQHFEDAINTWYQCRGKTCHSLRNNS